MCFHQSQNRKWSPNYKQIQKLQQPNIHISISHQVKPTYTYAYTYKKILQQLNINFKNQNLPSSNHNKRNQKKHNVNFYKHNTAIATQQKPTCEKVKQNLKLSTQLLTSSQQVPIQYSIIISKLNPITLYI